MNDRERTQNKPSRRQALKIAALAGAVGVAWKLGYRHSAVREKVVRRSRILMGTLVNLTVVSDDRDAAESTVDATLERMAFLETKLSRHRPDSELSILNRRGRLDTAGEDLRQVIQLAHQISSMGDGAFDISVLPLLEGYQLAQESGQQLPAERAVREALERVDYRAIHVDGPRVLFDQPGMAITLDGIGKGYVVDAGVAVLKQRGFDDVFVEAGGDLMAAGSREADRPWRVGIQNPRPGSATLASTFTTQDKAVATSGDYMQAFTPDFTNHHILDPRTGRSPTELASCTVMAPTVAWADGLATLAMVLDATQALELLGRIPQCEGYLISKNLRVSKTLGFPV